MSRSSPRRNRKKTHRPKASELRVWVDDFLGVNPSARFEDCTAALSAEGYEMPPADGLESLMKVWDEAQVQVLDNWRFGVAPG
jgi:hypothetical protein